MSVEAKQQKQLVIDEIKEKFQNSASAVVINYQGISVAEADNMRRTLRDENVDYTVYKNKLVARAIAGTEFESLTAILKGPNAFAFHKDDATAPARVIDSIMKELKKMEFVAGIVEGTEYDAEQLKALAAIPSREGLIAKFLGSVQNPISSFARVINALAEAGGGSSAEPKAKADDVEVAESVEKPAEVIEEATPVAEIAPAVEAETAEEQAEE